MPSKLPQINVRLTAEEVALIDELAARLAARHGVPHSKSDVIRAGLHALRQQYPDAQKKSGDGVDRC